MRLCITLALAAFSNTVRVSAQAAPTIVADGDEVTVTEEQVSACWCQIGISLLLSIPPSASPPTNLHETTKYTILDPQMKESIVVVWSTQPTYAVKC